MAGNEVEQDLDTLVVSLFDEGKEVIVGAEARVHLVVVEDVVSAILPGTYEAGRHPDTVETDAADVIQSLTNTVQVAHTVSIRVHIR